MTPSFITSDKSVEEGIALGFTLFQQLLTDSRSVFFCSKVSIRGTHLVHLLLHLTEDINFSTAPRLTPNSVLISFTVIRRLDLMSLSRRASFLHWWLCLSGQCEVCQSHLCKHIGSDELIFQTCCHCLSCSEPSRDQSEPEPTLISGPL